MATSVPPTPQSTPEAPPNELPPNEQPQGTPESTPPTPPTPQPTGGPTSREAILEATLRDFHAQNRELQRQLDASRMGVAPSPSAPPQKSADELRNEFFADPHGQTRNIIREELQSSIAPLNDLVRGLRFDGSPYSNMLNQFKTDPRFGPHMTSDVEQAVGRIMEKAELNAPNMQAAIVQAIGLKSAGLLGVALGSFSESPAPTPPAPAPPQPQPPVPPTPPHIRTSGPPPAGPNPNKPALRPLTENEERLRRQYRMSHEEYLAWLDEPADKVATSNIGRSDWKPGQGR